jgi:hypothetical protein
LTVDRELASAHAREASDGANDGRLATAGRAQNAHELAGFDVQIDAAQRLHGGRTFTEVNSD